MKHISDNQKNGLMLEFPKDGRPLTFNSTYYWASGFKNIILHHSDHLFPDVEVTLNGSGECAAALFHKHYTSTDELAANSLSIEDGIKIPESQVKALEHAIQKLHTVAEDPHCSPANADFLRNFMLPYPDQLPQAWRISNKRKQLILLWGITNNSSQACFLPLSHTSKKWQDAPSRLSISTLLKPYSTHYLLHFKIVCCLLAALLLIILAAKNCKGSDGPSVHPIEQMLIDDEKTAEKLEELKAKHNAERAQENQELAKLCNAILNNPNVPQDVKQAVQNYKNSLENSFASVDTTNEDGNTSAKNNTSAQNETSAQNTEKASQTNSNSDKQTNTVNADETNHTASQTTEQKTAENAQNLNAIEKRVQNGTATNDEIKLINEYKKSAENEKRRSTEENNLLSQNTENTSANIANEKDYAKSVQESNNRTKNIHNLKQEQKKNSENLAETTKSNQEERKQEDQKLQSNCENVLKQSDSVVSKDVKDAVQAVKEDIDNRENKLDNHHSSRTQDARQSTINRINERENQGKATKEEKDLKDALIQAQNNETQRNAKEKALIDHLDKNSKEIQKQEQAEAQTAQKRKNYKGTKPASAAEICTHCGYQTKELGMAVRVKSATVYGDDYEVQLVLLPSCDNISALKITSFKIGLIWQRDFDFQPKERILTFRLDKKELEDNDWRVSLDFEVQHNGCKCEGNFVKTLKAAKQITTLIIE